MLIDRALEPIECSILVAEAEMDLSDGVCRVVSGVPALKQVGQHRLRFTNLTGRGKRETQIRL
jgi:hypothetical protein